MTEFNEFLAKYYPEAGRSDVLIAAAYARAELGPPALDLRRTAMQLRPLSSN